jgi:hypothetical protein
MRPSASIVPLLGFAIMAAACQQPAESSPAAEGSAARERRKAAPAPSCSVPRHWNNVAARDPHGVTNTVSIDKAGAVHWNGAPVDMVRLRQYMDIVGTMLPTPGTAVEADPGSPCARIEEVVRIVGNAVECDRICSYAIRPFNRAAPPPPPPAPPPPPRR